MEFWEGRHCAVRNGLAVSNFEITIHDLIALRADFTLRRYTSSDTLKATPTCSFNPKTRWTAKSVPGKVYVNIAGVMAGAHKTSIRTLPLIRVPLSTCKMKNSLTISLLVGFGGFAGSLARYGLSVASQRFPIEWPIGTLAANVLGCLLIGIVTGLSDRSEIISPEARLALATGFCGGFTTMSSMIYEIAEMLRASEYLHASLYAAGTFLFSMAAFAVGVMAVRVLIRLGGGVWN